MLRPEQPAKWTSVIGIERNGPSGDLSWRSGVEVPTVPIYVGELICTGGGVDPEVVIQRSEITRTVGVVLRRI